ncbi:hypothetical protein [Janthinobacterium sp. ROICE36]|uniref:hypothetical protein n=1 Tax=Janthinobacterium sp. ROICE36 TaxID=2048670 RepID=UPI0011AECDEF|nr:hypothetical protein [Janthinobacterium sp. ROICE36]
MTKSASKRAPASKRLSTVAPPVTQLSATQLPAKIPAAKRPAQKSTSASKPPPTRSPGAQILGSHPSTTLGTKMTISDASRIYKTTALNGDGSVQPGSFAARAMRAAMLADNKVAMSDKSKSK